GSVVQNKYLLLKHIGGADWLLNARHEVLRQFYESFFFPQQGGARDISELPARIDSFWTNVYTGAPCRESKDAGDYAIQEANQFFGNATNSHGYAPGDFMSTPLTQELINKVKRPVPLLNFVIQPAPALNTRFGTA